MYTFLFIILTVGFINGLPASEKENIMVAMMPHVRKCSSEHGISEHQIHEAKGTGKVTELHQCLMGCIYKSIHVIDEKGLFDVEKSSEMYKKYFMNPNDQKMISDVLNTCSSVNDQKVEDGEKGCERGRLLFECLMPIQKEFFGQG